MSSQGQLDMLLYIVYFGFGLIFCILLTAIVKQSKAKRSYLRGEWNPAINRQTLPVTIRYNNQRLKRLLIGYPIISLLLIYLYGTTIDTKLFLGIALLIGIPIVFSTEMRNKTRHIDFKSVSFEYYHGHKTIHSVLYNEISSIDYLVTGRNIKTHSLVIQFYYGTKTTIHLDHFKQEDWRTMIEVIINQTPNIKISPNVACFLEGKI